MGSVCRLNNASGEDSFRRKIEGNIADLGCVGKTRSGGSTRTPDCAVRSDHSFTTVLYFDKQNVIVMLLET